MDKYLIKSSKDTNSKSSNDSSAYNGNEKYVFILFLHILLINLLQFCLKMSALLELSLTLEHTHTKKKD